MADAILDTVSADIVCEGQVFRASGHTVAFPGFTAVYEEGTDDEKKQDSAGKPLPRFDQGDKLTAEKIEPSQHFTQQPPTADTEASLIRAMEERGIGRPSTYAPTISTIIDRDYVTMRTRRSVRRRSAKALPACWLTSSSRLPITSSPPTWSTSWTRSKRAS